MFGFGRRVDKEYKAYRIKNTLMSNSELPLTVLAALAKTAIMRWPGKLLMFKNRSGTVLPLLLEKCALEAFRMVILPTSNTGHISHLID